MKLMASVITVIMEEHDSLHSWKAVGIFSSGVEMQKSGVFDSIWENLFCDVVLSNLIQATNLNNEMANTMKLFEWIDVDLI